MPRLKATHAEIRLSELKISKFTVIFDITAAIWLHSLQLSEADAPPT